MAYLCELETGQRVYLDNQGTQTIVTISSSQPGQQQQASNSMATGAWTAPPEAYRTGAGAVFKISTAQGDQFIQIQGSSVGVMGAIPPLGGAQPMQVQQTATLPTPTAQPMRPMEPMQSVQPMQPMEPMQPVQPMQPMEPMQMGDMQMSSNPMEMRMGNMEMRMGSQSAAQQPAAKPRQFCNQCGAKLEPGDRFCSSCGNALG